MKTILALAVALCAQAGFCTGHTNQFNTGRINLFNGRDLSGWTAVADHDVTGGYCAAEPTWFVTDGAIHTTGTPFGYLRTKRDDFANYRLHVEYRWWRETKNPNSGVFVHLSRETGTFIPTAIENQLCRGKAGDVLGLAGFRFSKFDPRSAYNPAKPLSGITRAPRRGIDVEKPFGEWNVMEIELKGDTLVNTINGTELNRIGGLSVSKGAIALQAEGGAAEFRNVWIEDLAATSIPEAEAEPEPDFASEFASEFSTEGASERKSEPETEPEAESEPETKSEPEPKAEPETESETNAEPEAQSEPEAESEPEPEPETKLASEPEPEPEPELVPAPAPGFVTAVVSTSLGDIGLELDANKAPLTVSNFVAYVKSGHYKDTIFHRVIDGFMIQGGGFTADMVQKPTLPPVKNEATNGLGNARGTIAMARTMVVDSATCQFFINLTDNSFLDYRAPNPQMFGYAVFGRVTKGMDVVDKIAKVRTGDVGLHQNVPVEPVVIKDIAVRE